MKVTLAYGRDGLEVSLPDDTDVIYPRHTTGLPDEVAEIQSALRSPVKSAPLAQKVHEGDKVVIVHSDITRATPNDRLLPVILAELEQAGIRRDDITLLNALGTHRRQTESELRTMLGKDVFENYRCLQHDAFDDANLVSLGVTSLGNPVRVNRTYMDADVKILTGFIEPHFFAGYSGGPKGVLPALAGAESVLSNHGREMIASPNSTWGVTGGNPIWEEMREVALMTKPTFLVNVTLNAAKEITAVFAGDMIEAHRKGCWFVRENAMVAVDEPYDIVITTNSGYPLDQNLYQCVKGMSAAGQVVCEKGSIVMAAACEDGLPDHGRYAELLALGGSPAGVLSMMEEPGFSAQDQWQVQIQAMLQQHADIYVYSDGLSDAQIAMALFAPCNDVAETVKGLQKDLGRRASICVLPEGPQTVPYLRT